MAQLETQMQMLMLWLMLTWAWEKGQSPTLNQGQQKPAPKKVHETMKGPRGTLPPTSPHRTNQKPKNERPQSRPCSLEGSMTIARLPKTLIPSLSSRRTQDTLSLTIHPKPKSPCMTFSRYGLSPIPMKIVVDQGRVVHHFVDHPIMADYGMLINY